MRKAETPRIFYGFAGLGAMAVGFLRNILKTLFDSPGYIASSLLVFAAFALAGVIAQRLLSTRLK